MVWIEVEVECRDKVGRWCLIPEAALVSKCSVKGSELCKLRLDEK